MLYLISICSLPALLIFGVYHLALWFNLCGFLRRPFWRRFAFASGISHVLLVLGFLSFTYINYLSSFDRAAGARNLELFLFGDTGIWRLGFIFDTLATATVLGVFSIFDLLDWSVGATTPLIVGLVLVVGTLQWYWIGACLGALFERVWSGLKTSDDELPDWF